MDPWEWSQSESEVVFQLGVDAGVGKDKLKVKIEATHLSVAVAGSPVFSKELSGKVTVDESYWSLEGPADSRKLVVNLCKKKSTQWRTLTKDEEETLPQKNVLDDDFDVMNLEHDDDDPERVEEQLENEKKLEARYKKLLSEKGLQHEDTLQTFFALFDNCIQLYRLNKLFDYLEAVVPACRKRTDKYKLKAIQALAFVLWKQSKFREALPLLHEMEDILGKGAALCENIAHTYNSLGNYDKAEDYFRQALRFIEQEHGSNRGNRGGVLLGLGLVRDRLGKHREALPVLKKAYEFYRDRANGAPASLQAKAGISCAKLHSKLGELSKAEAYIRESVHMYEVTCGETSPLTASAYFELGKCLWAQKKREDAQKALKRAYELESMKDAWDLVALLEIHNVLMDTHLKDTDHIDRAQFVGYFKTAEYITGRVKRDLPQDGNAAVYYKAAAELKAWGGSYFEAKELFNTAIPLFEAETTTDCTGLIQTCREMLAFCNRNLEGKQNSPMDFEIPGQRDDKGEAYSGPHICEVTGDEEEGSLADGVEIEEVGSRDAADAASASADGARRGALAPSTSMPPVGLAATECEYRAVRPDDFAAIKGLCAVHGWECLLGDEADLQRHLDAAGAGLCWAALRSGELAGFALCGSDGVFGHVLQLGGGLDSDSVQRELADRCVEACRERGLRGLRADVPADSGDGLFERLGWTVSHHVYTPPLFDERPPKKSRTAAVPQEGGPGHAGEPSEASSKLRRDGKDTNAYYKAWEDVNVERVLIEEEGGDPSIVPDLAPTQEDLGSDRQLDVVWRISKYAWDQSDKFVSIYVSFDGAGSLPAENIECVFRPRGVLVVIGSNGKQHWFKVPNLCREIDVAASKEKVKLDTVVLKLKKAEPGTKWSDLTDEKDKYEKQREYRINHGDLKGATTEELLADMYQHANDEDRAGLRDAMRVNREKRDEDTRRARQ